MGERSSQGFCAVLPTALCLWGSACLRDALQGQQDSFPSAHEAALVTEDSSCSRGLQQACARILV